MSARPTRIGPQTLAWRCIAFAHALRDHLRAAPIGEAALTALSPDEGRYAATRSNPPNIVLTTMSREIAVAFSRARMSAESMQTLDDRVVALAGVQAILERLTAADRDLRALLPHRLAILFAMLLPFGLASEAYWAPLLVATLAYAGFAFASLGIDADEAPAVDRGGAERRDQHPRHAGRGKPANGPVMRKRQGSGTPFSRLAGEGET